MAKRTPARLTWSVAPMIAVTALSLAACSNSQEPSNEKGTTPAVFTPSPSPGAEGHAADAESMSTGSLSAVLKKADGSSVGTATFAAKDGAVTITVQAAGLPPGFHGMHIHAAGKCEPNSANAMGAVADFNSAGAHYQAPGHTAMPSSGDLTSILINSDGKGQTTTVTDGITLDELTAGAGTSIIIHELPDNFGNIPSRYTLPGSPAGPDAATMATGDSGARVACGVIEHS